jgi:hypothetical protein
MTYAGRQYEETYLTVVSLLAQPFEPMPAHNSAMAQIMAILQQWWQSSSQELVKVEPQLNALIARLESHRCAAVALLC